MSSFLLSTGQLSFTACSPSPDLGLHSFYHMSLKWASHEHDEKSTFLIIYLFNHANTFTSICSRVKIHNNCHPCFGLQESTVRISAGANKFFGFPTELELDLGTELHSIFWQPLTSSLDDITSKVLLNQTEGYLPIFADWIAIVIVLESKYRHIIGVPITIEKNWYSSLFI